MSAATGDETREPRRAGLEGEGVHLVEVFSSLQGEGPELGTATLFVRFAECDLRCRWCDTPESWRRGAHCRLEVERCTGRFEQQPSPLSLDALCAALERLELPRHRWVSLTGGEPLLQPDAVAALARRVRGQGPGLWLETHGLHAAALERALPHLECVSMDWKLASDVHRVSDEKHAAPEPFHAAHEAFLAVAARAPRVVVKLVITPTSEDAEIDEAIDRIARTHRSACLVLQPVTPFAGVRERPSAARLHALARRAEARLPDVRVIPQLHPVLGAL